MDAQHAKDVAIALRDIRDGVGEILELSPECGSAAGKIIRAITQIEQAVSGGSGDDGLSPAGEPYGTRRRGRNKPKRYVCETVGGSEVLAEYRHDSSIPLRSPRETVEAVVDLLAAAKEPLLFETIQSGLARRLGSNRPDYQARIALRFLLFPDVGLAIRQKSRYSATDQRRIKRTAQNVLEKLGRE